MLSWCLSKSVFSSFKFPLYLDFFRGYFLFKNTFSMSEFAGFKNIWMSIVYKLKRCINRYCSANSKGGRTVPVCKIFFACSLNNRQAIILNSDPTALQMSCLKWSNCKIFSFLTPLLLVICFLSRLFSMSIYDYFKNITREATKKSSFISGRATKKRVKRMCH